MKRKHGPELNREIIEAACRLMDQLEGSEHALFERLPDGSRLSIEIAVLPPVDENSVGAMRTSPVAEAPDEDGRGVRGCQSG